MNYWTVLSIEYASRRSYLDDLFQLYPTISEGIRAVDAVKWQRIEAAFQARSCDDLIRELLALPLFPVKDSYVAYLKRDPSAIARNPKPSPGCAAAFARSACRSSTSAARSGGSQVTSYPTEKSAAPLDHIVRASSAPDSIVLDCFCGSGTTLAAAAKNGRRWIGIDQSPVAIKAATAKLKGVGATFSAVKAKSVQ